MYLLVDGGPLQTPARDRGIGRYTSALLGGLRAVRPGWRVEVLEHARLEPIPTDRVRGLPVRRFDAPLPYDLAAPENRAVNDRNYADWLTAHRPDHVLLASVFEKLGVVPKFVGPRPPVSAVLYDLIPVLFPEHYGVCRPDEAWYAQRVRDAAGVDALFAISAAAAADARRLLGPGCPRVLNVRGAVDPSFVPLPPDRLPAATAVVREKFGIDGPFVLYVGGPDYRKNLAGAVAGFAALPPEVRSGFRLVIACSLPGDIRDETLRTADRLGLAGRVVTTGYVSDEDLIALYQAARVFFFPSIYEGLGLPVLEALRCGTPVACSGCSSLPEFAGESAHLFDPHDPRSMARALGRALAEPEALGRDERVAFARSFTWERTAEAVAAEIESCRPARPRARRVAWVAADPPGPETVEWLGELEPEFHIELVLPTASITADLAARFRILAPDEIDGRHDAAPFDVVVVAVGETGILHPDIRTVAVRYRGLLILPSLHGITYPAGELSHLVGRAAGAVVTKPEDRQWVRTLTEAPVLALTDREAGRSLVAAALRATAARLDEADLRWVDAVANALAAVREPLPPTVFEDWAGLRRAADRTVTPLPAAA